MNIDCKSRGAVVPSADIHLETGLAKCRRCYSVFSFAQDPGVVPGGFRTKSKPQGRARSK